MESYPIPGESSRAELLILNSRFIASVGPAFSVDQAKEFLARVKMEFQDASHHVPAYQIGFGNNVIAHCSDAGEPSGTAGRPILAVIQGSGFGDIVMVVTRYFGGTKLGTGGLVRAYTGAAKKVISTLRRAEKRLMHTIILVFDYTFYNQVQLIITKHNGFIVGSAFGAQVEIMLDLTPDAYLGFQQEVTELTRGGVELEIISTEWKIVPLGE